MASYNAYSSPNQSYNPSTSSNQNYTPSAPPMQYSSCSTPNSDSYSSSYSGSYSSYPPAYPQQFGYNSGFQDNYNAFFPPGMNPEVIRSFQAVDQDRSGSIDERELQSALSSMYRGFGIRTVRLLLFLFKNPRGPSDTIGNESMNSF